MAIQIPFRNLLTITLAASLLAACVTHPTTGRQQLMLISDAQVTKMSYQAYEEMKGQQPLLPASHAYTQRVNRIADRIVQQAIQQYPASRNLAWEINVFQDDSPNAFAMAGGKMGVNSGLIDRFQLTDDELAQVIAHEVAHVVSGHTREKMSIAMSQQLGLDLAGLVLGLNEGAMQLASQIGQLAISLPFSRTMEFEADRIGIELAARAGYHPQAAMTLWEKLRRDSGPRPPEWLSTHPADERRMAEIQRLIPQMMPLYQAAR